MIIETYGDTLSVISTGAAVCDSLWVCSVCATGTLYLFDLVPVVFLDPVERR